MNTVFEAGQLLGADRAACVEFSGGDADLGAKTEFAAIGELRRCVMQHDRRINLVEKFACRGFVFRHDRIGVVRAVIADMRDRFIESIDDLRVRMAVIAQADLAQRLWQGALGRSGIDAIRASTSVVSNPSFGRATLSTPSPICAAALPACALSGSWALTISRNSTAGRTGGASLPRFRSL